jgi:hypothetical protein
VLPSEKPTSLLSKTTLSVIVVALLAAVFHIAPYWVAKLQTPPGTKFTGNLNISPDVMQYRVWARRTQKTGPLVDNTFTNEPNKPHLPVIFYYVLGKMSAMVGTEPEHTFYYVGAFLAFVFTIVLFLTIRLFMKSNYRTWWCFFIILIGGGLGAHLLLLENFAIVRNNFILNSLIVRPFKVRERLIFEGYRGHYVFTTLIDHHFLMIWLVTLLAVISFYYTVKKFSPFKVALTAFLYAAMTLLHLYEGITLIMITLGVVFFCWRKKLQTRPAVITALVCIVSVAACLWWQFNLFSSSELPISPWRALSVLASTLLLAYPLAWVMIFLGFSDFYRQAGLNECFLIGWATGCVVLLLSGPFYPYPDRGAITAQIPLYLIAAAIFFSMYRRVNWAAAVIIVVVLGATPVWILKHHWVQYSGYSPNKPYAWLGPGHREIVNELRSCATHEDVLLVDKAPPDWAADDLWLAPYHPGRLYCGHFFLTPQYEQKRTEAADFFEKNDTSEQIEFLERERIRFVYVNTQNDPVRFETVHDPEGFEQIPGLRLLKNTAVGSLFEFSPQSQNDRE